MKFVFKRNFFIYVTLFFFFTSCKEKKPLLISAGEYQCHHCKMNIVDMKFKAEVITNKGKILFFDAIECVHIWASENKASFDTIWLSDFDNPSHFIEAYNAYILQSDKLRSPMGGGLAAFSTIEAFTKAKEKFIGMRVLFSRLLKNNSNKHL